jgi:catalase-peroxidase
MNSEVKCPFMHGSTTTPVTGQQNKDWWPNQLNLDILRQHDTKSDPVAEVNYKEEVKKLDVDAAGGLRPLRAVLHPYDVARRWDISYW